MPSTYEQTKAWRAANPEKAREMKRRERARYRARYPEKVKAQKRAQRRRYGLSPAEVADMREARGPACPICRECSPPVIDRCHETGAVRGMICNSCNSALGFARDNPEILRSLATYLEKARLFS